MTAARSRWDRDAVVAGVVVCLTIAVPLTVLAALVDSDSTGLNAVFFFGSMAGFVIGTGCAAWSQERGTPLSHAVVTGILAYVGAQALFVAIRLLRGDEVRWFGVFFTLSLVVLAGMFGGLLGNQLRARGVLPASRRDAS